MLPAAPLRLGHGVLALAAAEVVMSVASRGAQQQRRPLGGTVARVFLRPSAFRLPWLEAQIVCDGVRKKAQSL